MSETLHSTAQWLAQNPYAFLAGFVLTVLGSLPALWQLSRALVKAIKAIWAKGLVPAYSGWKDSVKSEAIQHASQDNGYVESDVSFLVTAMPLTLGVIIFIPLGVIITYLELKYTQLEPSFLQFGFTFLILGLINMWATTFLFFEHLIRRRFIREAKREMAE